MTRIEGHPPAADYGPVIHLPDGYFDHRACTCPTCLDNLQSTADEAAADAIREES